MKFLTTIALLLVIVGGLNWLLVGLFHFNLVHFIFGMLGWLENLVCITVGIATLYCLPLLKKHSPSQCKKEQPDKDD